MIYDKRGAPKGGRVHWFLMYAPKWLKTDYTMSRNYLEHNYRFVRKGDATRADEYIVKRKSAHRWQLAYWDIAENLCEFRSFPNLYSLHECIAELHEAKQARESAYMETEEHKKREERLEYLRKYANERKGGGE